MADSRITPQDFQQASRPKRKRGQPATNSGASTSFLSPNQFTDLLDSEPEDEEEAKTPPSDTPDNKKRIPPIVIYSLLDNHSATLNSVNENYPPQ